MRVLAFDPGYDRLGVAILEKTTGRETLLYSDCIQTDKTATLSQRIFTLGRIIETLITEHTPDCIAIETLFFNKNVKTAIGVAQARGMILYLAEKAGCTIYEFGPQEIKVAVTGYGKSDKTAVYTMVQRLVRGVPEKAHDDEYDAIAVGITCLAQYAGSR